MRAILVLAFVTLSTASSIHYRPAATTNIYIVKSPAAKTQYHEQDSRGFYSYGYSDDTAARAEYTTLDGSSKGFYSYVDSDGKLQTVKYEAGRKQGFKAGATNLPKAPTDNGQAPAPVRDTPEVEMAKQAHFKAYREAMMRAALASETQQNVADEEVSEEQEDANKEQMEAALLQNSREQILAMMAQNNANDEDKNSIRNDSGEQEEEGNENNRLQDYNQAMQREQENGNDAQLSNAHRQMTTYTLNEPVTESDPPNLRTIYRLEDDKSSSVLKLGELNRKSFNYFQPTTLFETVRVPSNSYYTVLSPSNKYTVVTPTVLTSVPHLGNSLPISLSSTFQSHRINGKAA